MEYSVKLSRLPADFSFPERLRDRMAFDAAKGQLSFRGFMTKCTYDELSALSDDPDYHRALEQLFVLTSEEVAPRPAARGLPATILVATLGTAALVIAGLWFASRHALGDKPAGVLPPSAASAASR